MTPVADEAECSEEQITALVRHLRSYPTRRY
jgi:hypothetical protein